MLHLAMRKRSHQLRGIARLHGVITRLADIKDYEESERVAARIVAALVSISSAAMVRQVMRGVFEPGTART